MRRTDVTFEAVFPALCSVLQATATASCKQRGWAKTCQLFFDSGVFKGLLALMSVLINNPEQLEQPAAGADSLSAAAAAAATAADGSSNASAAKAAGAYTHRQPKARGSTFWEKGTGFGTGATSSSWNQDDWKLKQDVAEARACRLLRMISSILDPAACGAVAAVATGTTAATEESAVAAAASADAAAVASTASATPSSAADGTSCDDHQLPEAIAQFLDAMLNPILVSQLRNDSVLELAQHADRFDAVLDVIDSMIKCKCLTRSGSQPSHLSTVMELVSNIVARVRMYEAHRALALKETRDTEDHAERTSKLFQRFRKIHSLLKASVPADKTVMAMDPGNAYVAKMKQLQFGMKTIASLPNFHYAAEL